MIQHQKGGKYRVTKSHDMETIIKMKMYPYYMWEKQTSVHGKKREFSSCAPLTATEAKRQKHEGPHYLES